MRRSWNFIQVKSIIMEMKFGFMGLGRPYESKWSDGTGVTVYPDGSVINNETGDYIRYADAIDNKVENVETNPIIPRGENNVMLIGMFVLGVVAVVALARGGK